MSVKITKDNVASVMESIRELAGHRVLVGIPAEKGDRADSDDPNNAALLYIHEHGAPEANIPARPSLIPGVQRSQDYTNDQLKKAAQEALEGDKTSVVRRLHRIGLKAQSNIRQVIHEGNFAPLKPSTIRRRKARGITQEKPLIATAQMSNAITYVLRKV